MTDQSPLSLILKIDKKDQAQLAWFFLSITKYSKMKSVLDRFWGNLVSYSMKIKKQTRKLAAGCLKHCFEVVDKTDEVSYIYLRQGEADVV